MRNLVAASLVGAAAAAGAAGASTAPRASTLKLDFHQKRHFGALDKRASDLDVTLSSDEFRSLYWINVTIGTPGQVSSLAKLAPEITF